MTESSPTTAQLVARAEKAEKDLEEALKQVEVLLQTVGSAIRMIRYMKNSADAGELGQLKLLEQWLLEDSRTVSAWDEIPF